MRNLIRWFSRNNVSANFIMAAILIAGITTWFKLKKEISIIITRFSNNKYEIYEPIENIHKDQILKHSKIPADISDKIFKEAQSNAKGTSKFFSRNI